MAFDDLLRQVRDRDLALEQRHAHARASWRGLRSTWREGWTPTRIVLAGLVGGFLVGRARPMRKVTGLPASRWVQIGTSLWSLTASFRAKQAADTAEVAADEAGVAAEVAADTAEEAATEVAAATGAHPDPAPLAGGAAPGIADAVRPGVSDARRRVDAQWDTAPRPAEAATEVSER